MSELRGRDGGRKLYCEHCGEDIHIVPDFEPEVEYNMEQTLSDIAKEMEPEPAEEGEPVNPESQDWDELPESHVSQHPFRWKFIVLVLVLLVVAVVCTGFGISYSHYHSADYQVKCAKGFVSLEEYDQAIACMKEHWNWNLKILLLNLNWQIFTSGKTIR